MKISRDLEVKCGWCSRTSTLGEWDDKSYAACKNRKMKRLYIGLTNKKAFDNNDPHYYCCPKCEKWSRGSQLSIVNTEDTELLRLGGLPVFNYIKGDLLS